MSEKKCVEEGCGDAVKCYHFPDGSEKYHDYCEDHACADLYCFERRWVDLTQCPFHVLEKHTEVIKKKIKKYEDTLRLEASISKHKRLDSTLKKLEKRFSKSDVEKRYNTAGDYVDEVAFLPDSSAEFIQH